MNADYDSIITRLLGHCHFSDEREFAALFFAIGNVDDPTIDRALSRMAGAA